VLVAAVPERGGRALGRGGVGCGPAASRPRGGPASSPAESSRRVWPRQFSGRQRPLCRGRESAGRSGDPRSCRRGAAGARRWAGSAAEEQSVIRVGKDGVELSSGGAMRKARSAVSSTRQARVPFAEHIYVTWLDTCEQLTNLGAC